MLFFSRFPIIIIIIDVNPFSTVFAEHNNYNVVNFNEDNCLHIVFFFMNQKGMGPGCPWNEKRWQKAHCYSIAFGIW